MLHFWWQLVVWTWEALVSARGTSTLSVFVSAIVIPLLLLFLQWAGHGFSREGWHVVAKGRRANVSVSLIAFVVWFCFFVYYFFATVNDINRQARASTLKAQPPKESHLEPPSLAYQYASSPNLVITLDSIDGFDFKLQTGRTVLTNKREYRLFVKNDGKQSIVSLHLTDVMFPFPVEAAAISRVIDITNLTFQPNSHEFFNAGTVELPGCLASTNYEMKADKIAPQGYAEALLILNSTPLGLPSPPRFFILGDYQYRIAGKLVKAEFYAPLSVTDDNVVKLEAREVRPHPVTVVRNTVALPPGCVSSAALVAK